MNHKLKIKLIALTAILTSNALGNCQAMQADTNSPSANAVGSGVIRPAEGFGGAFGAVTPVQPVENYGAVGELPPIISPADAAAQPGKKMGITPPPIVTPSKTKQTQNTPAQNTPAQNTPAQTTPAQTAPAQTTPAQTAPAQFAPAKTSSMLAPLAPQQQASVQEDSVPSSETPALESPDSNAAVAYAPAPVIQATGAPVDAEDDQQVQQATQWNQQNQLPTKMSAAGIPLYPEATAAAYTSPQELPPIVQGSLEPANNNVSPVVSGVVQMPPIVTAQSQMVSPIAVDPNASSVMDPTYFSSPPMEAPVISSGCNSCGGAGCSSCGVAASAGGDLSGCQSCGPGGCYNDQQVAARFDACGSVYQARRYFLFDLMYFDRYDGTVSQSNFGSLNNFDEDVGLRFTFGNRQDATSGNEFTYMGTAELTQSQTVTDAAGRIELLLANTGGFAPTEMTAFRNAVSQTQIKQTELHTIEFNRVQWGWDVVKSFVGIRYIYVEDDYKVASENLGGDTGLFEIATKNNLVGGHFGNEWFYDVGYRLSWSAGSKWGIYANPNKVDTRLLNEGVQFLDIEDNSVSFAGSIELDLNGHYQLTKNARFRFGYTGLYLANVAGVSDNVPFFLTPLAGADTDDEGEMYFQAVSLGIEIYR